MVDRERLADRAPCGMAHKMRPLEPEMVHERHDVGSHLVNGIVDARGRGASTTAMIVEDDPEPTSKVAKMRSKEIGKTSKAGHQKKRWPLADYLEPEPIAVGKGKERHLRLALVTADWASDRRRASNRRVQPATARANPVPILHL